MTDTAPSADDELVMPPVVELPEFEGQIPVGVDTVLTGTSQRITRPIHHGEHGVLVVEYEVADVRHPKGKDGLKRKQMLKVVDSYELPGRFGPRLLNRLKKAYRLATDRSPVIAGFDQAEGAVDGAPVTTDGNGVVMTGGDMAALGLDDASLDPVMVVWESGEGALWPDDFGDGAERPTPGEEVFPPGDDAALLCVVRLVDPTSGETVAGWSDEEFQERLIAAEAVAMAEEDRAAVDELEAGRAKRTEGQLVNRQPFEEYDKADVALIRLWLEEDCPGATEAEWVAVYEEAHKGRKTVIKAARERVAELLMVDG